MPRTKWMDHLEVIQGAYYEVETVDCGTCIVPEEVCGRVPGLTKKRKGALGLPGSDETHWSLGDGWDEQVWLHLTQYVQGSKPYEITRKHGFCWRMTEPGYMDSTDWHAENTEKEVREAAKDLYDHDEEE